MEIMFGVAGLGSGHAIRSKQVIEHLSKKHNVKIFAGGQAYKILSKHFNVIKIPALELYYKNNQIRLLKTAIHNFGKLPIHLIRTYNILKKHNPKKIITDFEPFTSLYGNIKSIPTISISNINTLARAKVPKLNNLFLSRLAIKLINLNCTQYLLPTIKEYPLKKKKTKYTPPIIRKNIKRKLTTKKNLIVVYLTSSQYWRKLIEVLPKFPHKEFLIYGFNKNQTYKNIKFKKFSENEFTNNLNKAEAVITYGSFNTTTEAIYLKKPLLVIPIKDHPEQQLNAHSIKKIRAGMVADDLTYQKLKSFLRRKNKLTPPEIKVNDFTELDKLLKNNIS